MRRDAFLLVNMKVCYIAKAPHKQEAHKLNLGQLSQDEDIASEGNSVFITHYKYQIINIDPKKKDGK